MTNEFSGWCSLYYQLRMLYIEQQEQLKNLVDNAPVYCSQTTLGEIDAIMSYYREAQAEKVKADKTFDDLKKTEEIILYIMRHFEIPKGTVLTGVIPGEMELEVWTYGENKLFIEKIRDLEPEPVEPNTTVLKFLIKARGK